jgi:hypothetical protein
MNARKKLASPPIEEVVCGLCFPSIPELDPIAVGRFSHDIRDEYRQHAVQPPVTDQAGFTFALGAGPLRSWLISENDEWVIQLQHDRFYLNWRQRGGDYPRFSDEGEKKFARARRVCSLRGLLCPGVRSEAGGPACRGREGGPARAGQALAGFHTTRLVDADVQDVATAGCYRRRRHKAAGRGYQTRGRLRARIPLNYGMQSILGRLPSRGLRIETRANRALKNEKEDVRVRRLERAAERCLLRHVRGKRTRSLRGSNRMTASSWPTTLGAPAVTFPVLSEGTYAGRNRRPRTAASGSPLEWGVPANADECERVLRTAEASEMTQDPRGVPRGIPRGGQPRLDRPLPNASALASCAGWDVGCANDARGGGARAARGGDRRRYRRSRGGVATRCPRAAGPVEGVPDALPG